MRRASRSSSSEQRPPRPGFIALSCAISLRSPRNNRVPVRRRTHLQLAPVGNELICGIAQQMPQYILAPSDMDEAIERQVHVVRRPDPQARYVAAEPLAAVRESDPTRLEVRRGFQVSRYVPGRAQRDGDARAVEVFAAREGEVRATRPSVRQPDREPPSAKV